MYNMSISIGKPLHSVVTILFEDSRPSTDPIVLDLIQNAEAIFFAGIVCEKMLCFLTINNYSGGDQSLYIDYWSGTDVQSIIQDKVSFITVGGTSAGLAILGEWIYSAENGTVTSDEALAVRNQIQYVAYTSFLM